MSRLHALVAVACVLQVSVSAHCAEVPKPAMRTVHVFVALCDNEHQGIVPVPKLIGNGDDPANNMYWGAMYGTKTFLKRSGSWRLLSDQRDLSGAILERTIFRHATEDVVLVADAYRGADIKAAVTAFLRAAAGHDGAALDVGDDTASLHGDADLVVYVGHNGLMDFDVAPLEPARDGEGPQAMVFACKSKTFFQTRLEQTGCRPRLLTTGFMAPEAYTLDAAVSAWASDEPSATIRDRAAAAYHKYQRCGMSGARRLFYAGE